MALARRPVWIVALLVGITGLCGCGDDDGSSEAATLKDRLPSPTTFPGFKLERSLTWDNAIDFTVEGFSLPQTTHPSEAVKVFEDAGFAAGASHQLTKRQHEARLVLDAVQFDSDDGARDALDYAEKESLKQPCLGACSEVGSNFAVPGIPGARGVQQRPQAKPPAGAAPPFDAYAVGFTVGPYLYLAGGDGGPGAIVKDQVVDAARALYRSAGGGS